MATRRKDSPGSRLHVPLERSVQHCRVIDAGVCLPGEYSLHTAVEAVQETHQRYIWLALKEPSEEQMLKVAQQFDIHELIVEDAVSAHQRPKVERYDEQLFMVVRSVRYTDDTKVRDTRDVIVTGEVQMLIGRNFIVTVSHNAELPPILRQFSEDPELFSAGPAALAYRIADHFVDQYQRVASLLEHRVNELEEHVFTPGSDFSIDRIYLFKREILEMRHSTDPLVPALNSLVKDHKDLVPKKVRSYFRDVLDNESTVRDDIDAYDQRLTSLLDASVAKVTLQQNRDMRTISAFVGMAAVPTLIAGIYGMNFDYMPELHTRYGYFVVLAVIVALIIGMWWWFRRNDWL